MQAVGAGRSDAFSFTGNTMGVTSADLSAAGYYFWAQVSTSDREEAYKACEPSRRPADVSASPAI